MKSKLWVLTVTLLLSDMVLFIVSFLAAYWLRIVSGAFPSGFVPISMYFNILALSLLILAIVFSALRLYAEKRTLFDVDEFMKVFYGLAFVFLVLGSITFLFKVTRYSRLIILFTFVFSLIFIVTGRVVLRLVQRQFRKKGFNLRKTIIIGEKKKAQAIMQKIAESPELGYKIVGVLPESFAKISSIIRRRKVDVVFLQSSFAEKQEIYELIFANPQVRFNIIPDILEIVSEHISFEEFKDIPIMTIAEQTRLKPYDSAKRLLDRIVSAILLIVLMPLFALITILIIATSRGPVFYTHARLGKNRKEFRLYKFRTMHRNAPNIKARLRNQSSYLFKIKNDPRVTPVGKLLRRMCLDELPQLINIVRGEMSFVGPRPHLPGELHEFTGWKQRRFSVRPGLTGLWQVSGRHELNFDKTVAMDLYYIKNRSFVLDLKIILKTIPAILFSKGKW